MEEAGDLLEASWFFENLLHTKSRTMSRCYSDLSSSSCPPPLHSHPPLCSTEEHVEIEEKGSSFSSRKQPPVAYPGLTKTPSLPNSTETQSFLTKKPNPSPNLMRGSSISTSLVGSDPEVINVKKEGKSSSFSSRKQPPVARPSLTRTPSLPNSIESQSFRMKKPNPSPDLMRASSVPTSVVGSDQEDHINVKKERKSSSFSSRKQPPIAPPSLTRVPSLPTSIETQSFLTKKPIPSPYLTWTSSMATSVVISDQEDEEEEDQESEFTLGRLIRQASMNSSHTLNQPRQTPKTFTENMQKKPGLHQEKIGDMGSMEKNQSKSRKDSGRNYGGGGRGGVGGSVIPGGWVDKSSSEDMKAHIKFWARAVASNVRQECS
ncbi:transcription initiation factor TFIID subunit 12-like [Cynara cardunculus var. scolymus]|uniref:transcription initiation factor TFIID subunit 12-like n=1 Tax=Cynara cardunculus var. scolymus TaxID=59895 RepID=UPI000D62E909|nr:transcription initiation factor TFIID subunit 12-like [Cynara cardunculus var. scolymus]